MLLTIYADNDGYVEGSSATYATARTTAATAYEDTTPIVGQQLAGGTYRCFETFLSFPFASLGDYGANEYELLDIDLFLKCSGDGDDTTFTINAMVDDWGTSLTTGDWHNGATALTGDTFWSVASSEAVNGAYLEVPWSSLQTPRYELNTQFTADEHLRLLLYSSRHKAGNTPSGNEYLTFASAATAGTTSDPYMLIDYVDIHAADASNLTGALGPVSAWNRALSAAEVAQVMNLGQVILDRSLDSGTAVITGSVMTQAGTVVPATHVRSGWWLQNLDDPGTDERPKPLIITGASVNLASGENALTIGDDWMEAEIGVKMADLLALPAPADAVVTEDAVADYSDPVPADPLDDFTEPPYSEPVEVEPYTPPTEVEQLPVMGKSEGPSEDVRPK